MQKTDGSIYLSDGRRLAYAEYGDPEGKPLFYCHGFPASRFEAALLEPAACKARVRIVAVDRPGCGLSDFQPERLIGDWPRDVLEVADALGIERFAIVGVSGGGPYALACARKIPQRLTAVGVVCGLGPVHESWALRDMLWSRRLVFRLARRTPWLLKLSYVIMLEPVLRRWPSAILSIIARTPVMPDRRVLMHPETRRVLLASIQESVHGGSRGILHELSLYTREWDFRPEEVALTVDLWHGEADPIVPVVHARTLAKQLPRVRPVILPGEGHFSLPINHMERILLALTD